MLIMISRRLRSIYDYVANWLCTAHNQRSIDSHDHTVEVWMGIELLTSD